MVARYLATNFDLFFSKYHKVLVQSDSYVTKRQSIKLLGEILLDRANYNVMTAYVDSGEHLKLCMTLLRDDRKMVQYEGFHVFKVCSSHCYCSSHQGRQENGRRLGDGTIDRKNARRSLLQIRTNPWRCSEFSSITATDCSNSCPNSWRIAPRMTSSPMKRPFWCARSNYCPTSPWSPVTRPDRDQLQDDVMPPHCSWLCSLVETLHLTA